MKRRIIYEKDDTLDTINWVGEDGEVYEQIPYDFETNDLLNRNPKELQLIETIFEGMLRQFEELQETNKKVLKAYPTLS